MNTPLDVPDYSSDFEKRTESGCIRWNRILTCWMTTAKIEQMRAKMVLFENLEECCFPTVYDF